MTGTVHDRAIAEELRAIIREPDSLNWNTGDIPHRYVMQRADELEAAAPPATIDATYTGDEPPVGTVLVHETSAFVAMRSGTGWWETGTRRCWKWVGVHNAGPWTVLRWGLDG